MLAQLANRVLGTSLGPWDIPWLDETTLDVIQALATGAPKMRENMRKADAAKARYWAAFEQTRH